MNTEPLIRPFCKEDKEMVTAFFDQMGGETRSFFDVNSGNRKGALGFFDLPCEPNIKRFAALYDGRMVGYVFLWDLDTMTPWLGIAISEDWKGRHLGRKLLAYAEQYCHDLGKGGIFLTTHMANVRGQGLYARCGYQRLGIHNNGELLYFLPFSQQSSDQ